MKRERRIRIGFWRLPHGFGLKFRVDSEQNKILAFWLFWNKISMHLCIMISISIKKQYFFRLLGMIILWCKIVLMIRKNADFYCFLNIMQRSQNTGKIMIFVSDVCNLCVFCVYLWCVTTCGSYFPENKDNPRYPNLEKISRITCYHM